MSRPCQQENCTIEATGVCLLNNDPILCPNRTEGDSVGTLVQSSVLAPALSEPVKKPRFPLSLTLTPSDASEIMGRCYCSMVGILGVPDAGKTASLVSLFLLLAKRRLVGFSYRDSKSLMAFDEISQGARQWKDGNPPDQMTSHTELADDRTAGYLHLELFEDSSGRSIHLLLPDLPGEWSTALIDSNRTDRLEFLKRADVIWLMVDGTQLATPSTRQLTIHRVKLLIGRIGDFLQSPPRILLVVTRADKSSPTVGTLEDLQQEATKKGMCLKVVPIASFAEEGAVEPGFGLDHLIKETINLEIKPLETWPDGLMIDPTDRSINRFRQSEK